MWELYFFGAIASLVLGFFLQGLFWILGGITGDRVFGKNLRKIYIFSNGLSFSEVEVKPSVGMYLFEISISWLGFFFKCFLAIRGVYQILQHGFKHMPERVKEVRYPLFNNPNLSAESVWARWTAIPILLGDPINNSRLVDDLSRVQGKNEHFNVERALTALAELNVLKSEDLETLRTMTKNSPTLKVG